MKELAIPFLELSLRSIMQIIARTVFSILILSILNNFILFQELESTVIIICIIIILNPNYISSSNEKFFNLKESVVSFRAYSIMVFLTIFLILSLFIIDSMILSYILYNLFLLVNIKTIIPIIAILAIHAREYLYIAVSIILSIKWN